MRGIFKILALSTALTVLPVSGSLEHIVAKSNAGSTSVVSFVENPNREVVLDISRRVIPKINGEYGENKKFRDIVFYTKNALNGTKFYLAGFPCQTPNKCKILRKQLHKLAEFGHENHAPIVKNHISNDVPTNIINDNIKEYLIKEDKYKKRFNGNFTLIARFSKMYHVKDAPLYAGMIEAESAFEHFVYIRGKRYVKTSEDGAKGLGQHMFSNIKDLNESCEPLFEEGTIKRNGKQKRKHWSWSDVVNNPTVNLEATAATIACLSYRFGNNPKTIAAAYVAGPTKISRAIKKCNSRNYDSYFDCIESREAREEIRLYVSRVMQFRKQFSELGNLALY